MPKDDHPRAFLIYPYDFLFDDKVDAMTHLEFSAYMRLLFKSWYEKPVASIPTDDRDLARMTRMSADQWTECKAAVLSCFKPCSGKRLIQPRLAKEYQKLMAKKKIRSEAGKKGADSRWGNDDSNAIANAWQTHGDAMAKPDESHGIKPNNPITHITHNPLTRNVKDINNPIGGLGENDAAPPAEAKPRVFDFSSESGSWVGGCENPREVPWEKLPESVIFKVFEVLFITNQVRDVNELRRVVKNSKTTPARWTALFLDKVSYAWERLEDGTRRIDAGEIDIVGMTIAGFRPKNGKPPQEPSNSATGLFQEIFFDVFINPDEKSKKWRDLTNINIAAELAKRKGKRRK